MLYVRPILRTPKPSTINNFHPGEKSHCNAPLLLSAPVAQIGIGTCVVHGCAIVPWQLQTWNMSLTVVIFPTSVAHNEQVQLAAPRTDNRRV